MKKISGSVEDLNKVGTTYKNNLSVIKVNEFERATIKLTPLQFSSFKEILEIGLFNEGYYKHLEENELCRKAMLGPVSSTEDEELVLYWEGPKQVIPGGANIYNYFRSKGFEVIKKAHPSLLIVAMSQFTEEKLLELRIPARVDVVLPTDESSLLPNEYNKLCFLRTFRRDNKRVLFMGEFDIKWTDGFAFLVRKMTA